MKDTIDREKSALTIIWSLHRNRALEANNPPAAFSAQFYEPLKACHNDVDISEIILAAFWKKAQLDGEGSRGSLKIESKSFWRYAQLQVVKD